MSIEVRHRMKRQHKEMFSGGFKGRDSDQKAEIILHYKLLRISCGEIGLTTVS